MTVDVICCKYISESWGREKECNVRVSVSVSVRKRREVRACQLYDASEQRQLYDYRGHRVRSLAGLDPRSSAVQLLDIHPSIFVHSSAPRVRRFAGDARADQVPLYRLPTS